MVDDINHGARSHATWSASSTARNINCSGSLALILEADRPERESEAAAWGTCAHQIAEACLRDASVTPDSFVGKTMKAKKHSFEVDQEMVDTAAEFVDYVFGRMSEYHQATSETDTSDVKLWIEENFSLAQLKPPFDAGGTADAIIYFPAWRLLEVVDLKGGRGVVVEVKNNGQARTYSVGALINHANIKVDKVMSTIVQPRAAHPDGRIRSETLAVADLLMWTADLKDSMVNSAAAIAELPGGDDAAARSDWNRQWLKAGNHCTFCPVAASCPALEQKAMDAVGLWFDDMDKPQMANAPSSLSNEHLASVLDAADMVKDWLKAVASEAAYRAELGQEVPNYVLVEKFGRRSWKGEDEHIEYMLHNRQGLSPDAIYSQKLRSPAQIEKVLGAKRKDEIKDLWETPSRGVELARADKTTRAKTASTVNKFFNKMD